MEAKPLGQRPRGRKLKMERQCLDGCMEAAKDEKLEDVNRDN